MGVSDAETALEALERSQPKRARFFLRRYLGRDTELAELGGHVVRDGSCCARGCELRAPHAVVKTEVADGPASRQWLRLTADAVSCPASTETVEAASPSYEECPHCDRKASFMGNCQGCGFPL